MPNRCLEIQFDLTAAKSSGSALVPEKPATEVSILCFRVHRAGTCEVNPFWRFQLDLDFIRDCACNLILKPQQVPDAAIIIGPRVESLGEPGSAARLHGHDRPNVPPRPPTPPPLLFIFLAISCSGFLLPLYCMVDWREITRGAPIFPSSVISASVIPSAKYSCSGSAERFEVGAQLPLECADLCRVPGACLANAPHSALRAQRL